MLSDEEREWLREGEFDSFGNQMERVERIVRAHEAKAWNEGYERGYDASDMGRDYIPDNPYKE